MFAISMSALDCMAHILGSTLPLYFIDMEKLGIRLKLSKIDRSICNKAKAKQDRPEHR